MKKYFSLFLLGTTVIILFSTGFQPAANQILAFGKIYHNNENLGGVSVKVFDGKKLVKQSITGRNVGYGFSLNYNKNYRIELTREGYLKQTILINTTVSEEVLAYGDRLLWEPEIHLHKIMPGLEIDEFPKPVAKYIFSEELWGFAPDNSYEKRVASQNTRIEKTLNTLQKKAYSNSQQKADSLFNAENYEEALVAYSNAYNFDPSDDYAKKQMRTAQKLLRTQKDLDIEFHVSINKADEYLAKKNFEKATDYYQKALVYKPKEVYPLDRLYEIDSIRSYAWLTRVNEYENYINQADSLFRLEQYDAATENYSSSLSIFSKKDYPKHKLDQIDSIKKVLVQAAKQEKQQADNSENILQKDNLVFSLKTDRNLTVAAAIPDDFPMQSNASGTTEKDALTSKKNLNESLASTADNPEIAEETATDTLVDFNRDAQANILQLKEALKAELKAENKKSSANILKEIGRIQHQENRLSEALEAYNESLELIREEGDNEEELELLNDIAIVLYDSGEYHASISQFEQSLQLAAKANKEEKRADILENMATVYESTFQYDNAIEQLEKAKAIKIKLDDDIGESQVYKNLGKIYYQQNNFRAAAEEINKAVAIEAKLENKQALSSSLNALGASYFNMNKLDSAKTLYEQSLETSRSVNNQKEASISLNNIGNINFEQGKYAEAIDLYEQSLELKTEIDYQEGIALSMHNIGNSYFKLGQYDEAIKFYTTSYNIAKEANYFELVWRNYEAFARSYAAKQQYQKAFEYYKQYTTLKYESYGEGMQLVELQDQFESSQLAVRNLRKELQKQSRIARYEAERNRREIQIFELEVANKQQQLKRQRIIIISFLVGSALILLFLLLLGKQYQLIRKAYRIVAEQKRNITEGITYAARIQRAVSPPVDIVNRLLPNHFILNRPCEVVGGDFYWVTQYASKTVVAVADCTGHGVPGGFMSMLGISLINEILSSGNNLQTHEILTQLRDRVVNALHQKGGDSESLDGMDITLIMMDPKDRTVQFSSAYHSLHIIRKGEYEKVKGDRIPIGFHFQHKPFTSQSITLEKDDMIYMTTDGYTDQIGGPEQSRYMLGPFRQQLTSFWNKPLVDQKAILARNLDNWKGNLPQTDDVLVMGIKLV